MMTYRNPAERVVGSIPSFYLVLAERARRERLRAEMARRQRRRQRIERVKGWFRLPRSKAERASGASCLVDVTRQS